jgi:hypothetical protein
VAEGSAEFLVLAEFKTGFLTGKHEDMKTGREAGEFLMELIGLG